MKRLVVERTQHAIGQGGFHSSHFFAQGESFGFVFDCGGGTSEHREKLVKDMTSAPRLELDWLVISHLDEDHINGIRELEDNNVTFSNVFLPHVNLQQSMLLMLSKMIATTAGAVTDAQLGAILIAVKLYAGAYGRPRIVVRGDVAEDVRLPGLDGLRDLTPAGARPPSELLEGTAIKASLATRGLGIQFPDTRSIHVKDADWQFRFYSREWEFAGPIAAIWDLPVLLPLRNAINQLALLGTANGNGFTDNILVELAAPVTRSVANGALKAFGAGAAPTKPTSVNGLLKLLYKTVPGLHDYNGSSLCMYSGPANNSATMARQWFVRRTSLSRNDAASAGVTRVVGWLGTGDAHFRSADELAHFYDHYRRELRLLSTLMLPHHGSRHNYDEDRISLHGLLDALPTSPAPTLIVASNPAHKKFRHPHAEVVEVSKRYGTLHNVNLDRNSVFEESISTERRYGCPWYD